MKLTTLLFVLLLSACSTQNFNFTQSKRAVPTVQGTHHFFFWGIGQEKNVNPAEICQKNQKVETVETHLTFLNAFLSSLTVGIYYPRSYAVYCSND